MPASRGFTATSQAVRDVADRALAQPEGVTLTWLAKDYGLRACELRSRSFQVSFCGLRARSRRQRVIHHRDEPTFGVDLQSRGLYDRLACLRSPLPDNSGWTIRLCEAHDVLDGVIITDNATGEELRGENADERRRRVLIGALQDARKCHSVSRDDWEWLCATTEGVRESFASWLNTEGWRPDLYRAVNGDAHTPFVGQDALLDELGEDAFAEISNEGEEGA